MLEKTRKFSGADATTDWLLTIHGIAQERAFQHKA